MNSDKGFNKWVYKNWGEKTRGFYVLWNEEPFYCCGWSRMWNTYLQWFSNESM